MDAIEKRARELLAAEYMLSLSGAGPKQRHLHACAIRAIIAALTPPEGYVLVPVETLEDLASDAEEYVRSTEFRRSQIESKLSSVREARALLAARPEVP